MCFVKPSILTSHFSILFEFRSSVDPPPAALDSRLLPPQFSDLLLPPAGPARLASTREVRHHDGHPVWNERFRSYLAHDFEALDFTVKDDDAVGTDKLGAARVTSGTLARGGVFEGWLPLLDRKGRPVAWGGELRMRLQFVGVGVDEEYRKGPGPVPHTYFRLRRMCRVTAYHVSLQQGLSTLLLGKGEALVEVRGLELGNAETTIDRGCPTAHITWQDVTGKRMIGVTSSLLD
jgi:hypothetical protein